MNAQDRFVGQLVESQLSARRSVPALRVDRLSRRRVPEPMRANELAGLLSLRAAAPSTPTYATLFFVPFSTEFDESSIVVKTTPSTVYDIFVRRVRGRRRKLRLAYVAWATHKERAIPLVKNDHGYVHSGDLRLQLVGCVYANESGVIFDGPVTQHVWSYKPGLPEIRLLP